MTEFGRAAGKRFPTGMVWHGRVWSSSLLGLAPMNTKTIGLTAAFILGFWTSFACAQQQAIVPHAVIAPHNRETCFQILELEELQVDPQTGKALVYPGQFNLLLDYNAVVAWLMGFISATNVMSGNEPLGPQTFRNWMIWLFSYCRANPENNLAMAAAQLADAIRRH
jgi:hypothetical protein